MCKSKAAIYHFTDGGNKRPIVYEKEIERIREYASEIGYTDTDLYFDRSLLKRDQLQLQMLLQDVYNYDALIMKDFYHLRKNTGAFVSDLIALGRKGVTLYTLEDGSFQFREIPLNQPLRVAIYYCGLEIVGRSIELQFEIMRYFIRNCTNWRLVDEYADVFGKRTDKNQEELQKLIINRNKYDVVLVQSFNDIHWRTAKFCKIRKEIQTDIYSMHDEVYLKYEGGSNDEV